MVVIQIKIDKNWSQLYDEDVLSANYNNLCLLLMTMIVNVFFDTFTMDAPVERSVTIDSS